MLAETVCSAVAAAGLGIAAITAWRRKFLTATRIAAYALVPLGLVMTGAIDWLFEALTFNLTVWAGFGVLGLSWLLFMSSRAVERRRAGKKAATGGETPSAVAPAASAPSLGAGRSAPAAKQQAKPADEDFSDIEAILKKHGI
ncbi:hypothetical protein KV205_17955 [Streptomyces sp. SKN60]|uniref:hypothetical protein n=1 Tax=Streptomyces sp. SKN60 TaxID=2855506 RepID=UPI0022452D6E|nr:hypothetical protein [Streptomyces sp. SKN60]MCX2182401.1 hypothetical protein [Streptomyces sp. SKN60]